MQKHIPGIAIAGMMFMAVSCSAPPQKQEHGNEKPKKEIETEKAEIPSGAVSVNYRHHLYCEVKLRDSIPARMIFDTGSTDLLLDSTFYTEKFGKEGKLQKAMLGGAGDGYEAANIDRSGWEYRIGEETKREDMAIIVNLRKITGEGTDGIFGMEFMKDRRVEFNYEDGYMRFLPDEEVIGNDFTRIQCKWLDGSMRIIMPLSMTLADGHDFAGNFLIDTGMSGTLSLNSSTAEKLRRTGTVPDARRMVYNVGGIGGSREDYVFKSSGISLGGHTIKEVRVTWSGNKQGSQADTRYDGIIGNELLDRFDVIFDFKECVVYLRPNGRFYAPQQNDFGIAFTPMKEHWIVNGILEGGNAEKAGLRVGDRIEAINGITAEENNAKNLYPLPERLVLTVKREEGLREIVVEKE